MNPRRLVLVLACLASCSLLAADDHKAPAKGKSSALENFKKLAGDWTGKMTMDGQTMDNAEVRYRVTSGGTAVVETLAPGNEHEMVTVIHADGDDLLLTHYCAIGNQPRMKAAGKGATDKFDFQFVGGANLNPDKDMHMHNVLYTLTDNDTLKAEWTNYQNGKSAGKVVFEFKRKK